MKKKISKKNKKSKVITLPLQMFAKSKTPILEYRKAAKKAVNEIKSHFKIKGHGWPLDYSLYVSDIFWLVHGHHLEDYLLKELAKSGLKIQLTSTQTHGLMIEKLK